MYPGLLEEMTSRNELFRKVFAEAWNPFYKFTDREYIPYPPTSVEWAIRSILLVRGARPYVLVVDDIRKEQADAPHNYRWMMNNRSKMELDAYGGETKGEFKLQMAPGSTPVEATLFHLPDAGDEAGKPRLLVRDLSEADNSRQPAIRLDRTEFKPAKGMEKDFYLNEQVNRVLIDRTGVVEPKYKVLFFPYRVGEKLPKTAWNADKTVLTIDLQNGTVDTIKFDASNPDHRTRLLFSRK
jgi:hypothetical protein